MERRAFLSAAMAFSTVACAGRRHEPSYAFESDRITVSARGRGQDIVFVAGLGCHSDVWAPTAQALETRYRCHLVQLNGFAGTLANANGSGPIMAPVALEIVRYINHARLYRPAVVGHSMGGSIAMIAASQPRSPVGRLMVVDMPPFAGIYFGPEGSTPENLRPRADELALQVRSAPPGTIAPFLDQMFSGMARDEQARSQILAWVRASDQAVVAEALREIILTDLRPELPLIAAPTTIFFSLPDDETDDSAVRAPFRDLAHARFIRAAHANHFIMLDQPQQTINVIVGFMAAPS